MASVFTKIINGDIPGRFVYTDDLVVAFLTIAPVTPGHVLVVPRQEVDRWESIDSELWCALNRVAQKVGQATKSAFGSDRVGLLVAGFEVPHLHLHVFPANDMSGYDLTQADTHATPEALDDAAAKIRHELTKL